MSHESNLKPIPRNSSKEEIRRIFNGISELKVSQAIHEAVEEVNAEKGRNDGRKIKLLNSFHIDKIFRALGDAPGYESIDTLPRSNREIADIVEKTIIEISKHKKIDSEVISLICQKHNISEKHITRVLGMNPKNN